MWPFRASRDPLQQRSPETTAELLIRLMKEQNDLLRELIPALTGQHARTPRVAMPIVSDRRIRTDKDVFVVNRDLVLAQQRAKEEAEIAPWRTPANGRDSATSNPTPGIGAPVSLPPDTM